MLRNKFIKMISVVVAATLFIGLVTTFFGNTVYAQDLNIINGNGLNIHLYKSSSFINGNSGTEITDGSSNPVFDGIVLEPGFTLLEYFSLVCDNGSNESVDYTFDFKITSGSDLSDLAKVIDVYYVITDESLGTDRDTALSQMNYAGTLSELNKTENGIEINLINAEGNGTVNFAIALRMQPSAGNTYSGKNLFTSENGQFNVTVSAAQKTNTNNQ